MLALIVSTAAIWAQSRKTQTALHNLETANRKTQTALHNLETANRIHRAYIIENFPLLDGLAMASVGQARKFVTRPVNPAVLAEAKQAYEKAINVYTHASNLPPVDVESRVIIARAYSRLGSIHAALCDAAQAANVPAFGQMKEAEDDYRESRNLFTELLEQYPDDPKVRRGFADALGVGGQGCYYNFTKHLPRDGEPYYRQAMELWRSLVREAGTKPSSEQGAPAPEITASDLSDMYSLGNTVWILAGILEGRKEFKEAENLRQQLDDDVTALAERLSSSSGRQYWANQLLTEGMLALKQEDPTSTITAVLDFRIVTILDPNNINAHNDLAWSMTRFPGPAPFRVERALSSARKAIELDGKNWMYWNTLGVAAYRAEDWKTAEKSLRKSINLNSGGGAIDFFFLAMTRWRQGDHKEARDLFNQGANYFKHNPTENELRRFFAEADKLLNPPAPESKPKKNECDSGDNVSEGAEQCSTSPKHYGPFVTPDPWVVPLPENASDG